MQSKSKISKLYLMISAYMKILFLDTVETRIKEPTFIRTLRLKFNILNPLNKNLSEAETGEGSYITGFMSSEFTRTLKNS